MTEAVDNELLEIATRMIRRGQDLTMDALARAAGISRSTAHRRTGGRVALIAALAARGVDAESLSTRARLLTTARRVVATHGLVGTSVESLAAQAGVSPMTVYRLFGDRETLLREALADVFPAPAMEHLVRSDTPMEPILERLAETLIRFASTYPGLMALMLVPSSADRAEIMQIHGLQLDMRDRMVALFEQREATGELSPGDAVERVGAFSGLCLGASLLMHEVRPLREGDVVPRARRVVRDFLTILNAGSES